MTGREIYEIYNETSASHHYIVGFSFKGSVYAVEVNGAIPFNFLRETVTSSKRHGAVALRVYIRKALKMELLETAKKVGTVEDLKADARYNKGDNFERMICESFGIAWKKDSTLYTEAGDLMVNVIQYQVKYDNASLRNEYTLRRNLPANFFEEI